MRYESLKYRKSCADSLKRTLDTTKCELCRKVGVVIDWDYKTHQMLGLLCRNCKTAVRLYYRGKFVPTPLYESKIQKYLSLPELVVDIVKINGVKEVVFARGNGQSLNGITRRIIGYVCGNPWYLGSPLPTSHGNIQLEYAPKLPLTDEGLYLKHHWKELKHEYKEYLKLNPEKVIRFTIKSDTS